MIFSAIFFGVEPKNIIFATFCEKMVPNGKI